MNLFFDTSALLKPFRKEEGTYKLLALVAQEEHAIWVSELARLEFTSALYRRRRSKELSRARLEEAIAGLDEEWINYQVEPLGSSVVQEAIKLLQDHGLSLGLRTLDALQLATYNLVAEHDWQFVTADQRLTEITRELGFSVFNPLEEQSEE